MVKQPKMPIIKRNGRLYLRIPAKPYTKSQLRKFPSLKKMAHPTYFPVTQRQAALYRKIQELRH